MACIHSWQRLLQSERWFQIHQWNQYSRPNGLSIQFPCAKSSIHIHNIDGLFDCELCNFQLKTYACAMCTLARSPIFIFVCNLIRNVCCLHFINEIYVCVCVRTGKCVVWLRPKSHHDWKREEYDENICISFVVLLLMFAANGYYLLFSKRLTIKCTVHSAHTYNFQMYIYAKWKS